MSLYSDLHALSRSIMISLSYENDQSSQISHPGESLAFIALIVAEGWPEFGVGRRGGKGHCENRALPKLNMCLDLSPVAAPDIYTRPTSDPSSRLLSFPSPGDHSVERASHHVKQIRIHILKKKK